VAECGRSPVWSECCEVVSLTLANSETRQHIIMKLSQQPSIRTLYVRLSVQLRVVMFCSRVLSAETIWGADAAVDE